MIRMKNKLLKDKVTWIIVALVAIIALLILFLPDSDVKPFKIEDRCGPIVNLISHTIADDVACEMQCRNQCKVRDKKFKKIEFNLETKRCNSCECFCK